MHYILGAIALIILAIAVPAVYLALAVAYIILSGLVVMLVVRLITQSAPPLSSCVKAVIYNFIFTLIAGLIALKLLTLSLVAIFIAPLLILLVQGAVYSSILGLGLGSGIAVSLGVGALGWLLSQVFKGSAQVVLKTFS
jgi:hypothetical protein